MIERRCGFPEGCDRKVTKGVEVAQLNFRYFTCEEHLPLILMSVQMETWNADVNVVDFK